MRPIVLSQVQLTALQAYPGPLGNGPLGNTSAHTISATDENAVASVLTPAKKGCKSGVIPMAPESVPDNRQDRTSPTDRHGPTSAAGSRLQERHVQPIYIWPLFSVDLLHVKVFPRREIG